jgi:hypothetical protein
MVGCGGQQSCCFLIGTACCQLVGSASHQEKQLRVFKKSLLLLVHVRFTQRDLGQGPDCVWLPLALCTLFAARMRRTLQLL